MFKFGPAVTLNEIVQAVNQVGAAPGDVMAVLEALKQAGALRAELLVIQVMGRRTSMVNRHRVIPTSTVAMRCKPRLALIKSQLCAK